MAINVSQFCEYILRPTLKNVGLYSLDAEHLLLGTCAVESEMGTYCHQINGPALGIYQMEPSTHNDIWKNYISYHQKLRDKILFEFNFKTVPEPEELIINLGYATVMARVHYLRIKDPLPKLNNLEEMASYYKRYYNTNGGKGSSDKFIDAYNRYIKGKLYELS